MEKVKEVKIGNITLGGSNPLALIAGPCVIESEEIVLKIAEWIKEISIRLGIPFIFKASYKKDNRSSLDSFQGPGLKNGLEILSKVKEKFNLPLLSDVHYPQEVEEAAQVLDVIQIPAFLSMQSELTVEVAKTGKVVNVKKGQFLAPADMKHIIAKIETTGNQKILLTERGTSFGYHNLIVDFRSFPILHSFGYPVVFDVTHSIRVYGKPSSDPAGGEPQFIPYLAKAGVAAGCEAIFIETHPNPKEALCDAASMWPLNNLEDLLKKLMEIDSLVRSR